MISLCMRCNVADKSECSSCKEIQELDNRAPSGLYSIKTSRGQILKNVSSNNCSSSQRRQTAYFCPYFAKH